MCSVKLNTFVYGFAWIGGLFIVLLIFRKITSAFQLVLLSLIGFVIAVSVLSFNPFVTTPREGKPLLYPLQEDINIFIFHNMTEDLFYKTRVERLILSIFSVSTGARYFGTHSELKIPFKQEPGEFITFSHPDTILAGWGMMESGIVVLLLISFCLMIFYRKYSDGSKVAIYCLFCILITVFTTLVSNNSRHTSQVWLLFVFGITAVLQYAMKWSKFMGVLLILITFYNSWQVAIIFFRYNQTYTERVRENMRVLADYSQSHKFFLNLKFFYSVRIRLKEAGVKFTSIEESVQCELINIFSSKFPDYELYRCS